MHENPYETNQVAREPEVVVTSLPRASVGTATTGLPGRHPSYYFSNRLIYFLLLGFGERLQQYASDPSNPELRLTFLRQRNQYATFHSCVHDLLLCLESSSLQGVWVNDSWVCALRIDSATG